MRWKLSYNLCKVVTLTGLMNKSIIIWKNVKINTSYQSYPILWEWIEIGDNVYLNWLNDFYSDKDNRVIIWKYCSIAVWATFIAKMGHNYHQLSTYVWETFKDEFEDYWWNINIWNDVRIWRYAIILKWVTIGNWAVVWAWSVVTKNVPPYAIVWWNPAKIIKYRFDEKTIKEIQKSERWNRDEEKIKSNYNLEFLRNNMKIC